MALKVDWGRRVSQVHDSLTRSEQTLLNFITGQPQEAAFMSLKELCEATEVSKPKVIEFYRKLGYEGFKEFRQGILAFYEHHIDSYRASYTTFRQINSIEELREAAVAVDVGALQRMTSHVSSEDLSFTAEAILQARTVHVFGPGTGALPAEFLAQRLRRYKVNVHYIASDLQHLAEELYPIGSEDLLLLFHYAANTEQSMTSMQVARDQGATVVAVAGTILLDFVELVDRAIYVVRGEMGFKNSMAVPMCFANLLLLTVEFLGGEELQKHLKELEEKRGRYDLLRLA